MTVQRNLRVLKEDCENILARCTEVRYIPVFHVNVNQSVRCPVLPK